ncbi:MAG: hypothetical protein MJD61_21145 [Proteobacteria bacterium]|nr:hypothetical protein [Pseudomonadota bacterium]
MAWENLNADATSAVSRRGAGDLAAVAAGRSNEAPQRLQAPRQLSSDQARLHPDRSDKARQPAADWPPHSVDRLARCTTVEHEAAEPSLAAARHAIHDAGRRCAIRQLRWQGDPAWALYLAARVRCPADRP